MTINSSSFASSSLSVSRWVSSLNPFNPSTTIDYSVSQRGHVSIVIYDLNGAEVKTLVNEFKTESSYSANWNGKNNSGQSVASGQYFYVMNAPGGFSTTKYMTLLK